MSRSQSTGLFCFLLQVELVRDQYFFSQNQKDEVLEAPETRILFIYSN